MAKLVNYKTQIKNMQPLSPAEYQRIKKRLKVLGWNLSQVAEACDTGVAYVTHAAKNQRHGEVADRVKAKLVQILGEDGWNPYVLPRTEENIESQMEHIND